MADFDRARPLWEITLVKGLAGGAAGGAGEEAALLCKLHHSLTDGVGGVEIAMNLFDLARGGTERGPIPQIPAASRPGPLEGLRSSAGYDAGLVGTVARGLVTSAPRAAYAAGRLPRLPDRRVQRDPGAGPPADR